MINTKTSSQVIALIVFLCVMASDFIARINSYFGVSNGSTAISIALNIAFLFFLVMLIIRFNIRLGIPIICFYIFVFFMASMVVSFLRGIYAASDYWDWKYLFGSVFFTSLLPLSIVVGVYFKIGIKIYRFILRFLFVGGFAVLPIGYLFPEDSQTFARVMAPVFLFILFLPYLNRRDKILVLIVGVMSITSDFGYRSNLLRVVFAFVLFGVYFFRNYVGKRLLNFASILLFCLPLIFLGTAITGYFNIFSDNQVEIEVATEGKNDFGTAQVGVDTRSFIYVESYTSMERRDASFIFGEGAGAGYESIFFQYEAVNGRGRYSSEVAFVNSLLSSGLVGVLLFSLIIFSAVYYSINVSNNYLSKMLGLFLAFRWVMYFVEDIQQIDMNYLFLWILIGLCWSNEFRKMTDQQVRLFFQ